MTKIRKIGRLWKVDPEGFILNDADSSNIIPPYSLLIDEIKELYKPIIGTKVHSLYTRGTVARGVAVKGLSDMDIIALLIAEENGPEILDIKKRERHIFDKYSQKYGFPKLDSVSFIPFSEVADISHFSEEIFQLKVQSICLMGENYAANIPNFKISVPVANCNIVQIKPDIEEAKKELKDTDDSDVIIYWSKRINKNILRAGMSLVMLKSHKYTQDIYFCYKLFGRYYPEHEKNIRKAMEFVINPSADKKKLLDFLKEFGSKMIEIANSWLSDNNPSHRIDLPI